MSEIKPCPFCGSSASYWEDNHYDDRHVIECQNCGTSRRSEYGYEDVLEDWNRRYDAEGKEILDTVNRQFLPRVLAKLPNGGKLVVWTGNERFEDLAVAREEAKNLLNQIALEDQVIEVSGGK